VASKNYKNLPQKLNSLWEQKSKYKMNEMFLLALFKVAFPQSLTDFLKKLSVYGENAKK
jgi:hypothetical protein